MIRQILFAVVVMTALAAGAMYVAYGEIDPCRALAVADARQTEHTVGLPVAGMVEPIHRLETSQMSTRECAGNLLGLWLKRLLREIHGIFAELG